MEVPAYPMDHGRALAATASVMMFFNSGITLILAFIYIVGRSVSWEEEWVGDEWVDNSVILWEWVLAGVFMTAAAGAGVAGGIAAARSTRYTLAMVAAVMLLGAAVIVQMDWYRFTEQRYGELFFVLVLALLPVVLLLMAKPSFRDPLPTRDPSPGPFGTDNYGWSTLPDGARHREGGRRGVRR
jgi:hypothetical protein